MKTPIYLLTWLIICFIRSGSSFVPTSRIHPKIASFPFDSVALHAKRKQPSPSSASPLPSSPLDSLLKFVTPGHQQNSMGSGIEAALILTDKKRQEDWKNDMRQQFPLVPPVAIDICVDSLSEGFSAMAPAQLKAALRPGGLDKVRPDLETTIVANLEKQQVVKNIPLKPDDKRQLLQYLVTKSLDYVLKDAELALAEPAVKLQALESQKQQIQRYMTFWELSWYRIRYFPLQAALVGILSTYVTYSLYRQTKDTWIVSTITTVAVSMLTHFKLWTLKLLKLLGLGTTKSLKKKTVHRLTRR